MQLLGSARQGALLGSAGGGGEGGGGRRGEGKWREGMILFK